MTALFILMAVDFDPGLAGAVALTGISCIFLFASSFMRHAAREGEDGSIKAYPFIRECVTAVSG
jgi:hypothetical protein